MSSRTSTLISSLDIQVSNLAKSTGTDQNQHYNWHAQGLTLLDTNSFEAYSSDPSPPQFRDPFSTPESHLNMDTTLPSTPPSPTSGGPQTAAEAIMAEYYAVEFLQQVNDQVLLETRAGEFLNNGWTNVKADTGEREDVHPFATGTEVIVIADSNQADMQDGQVASRKHILPRCSDCKCTFSNTSALLQHRCPRTIELIQRGVFDKSETKEGRFRAFTAKHLEGISRFINPRTEPHCGKKNG